MASTKAGQLIEQEWRNVKGVLLGVGLLNAIGDKQGEFIRLQNLSQMSQEADRNGKTMSKLKASTIAQRRRQHVQDPTKTNLKRTGGFWDAIKASGQKSKITKDNTGASIQIEITVPKKYQPRLKAFRTGNYGKNTGHPKRLVVGMADPGTALRTRQEKEMKRIAVREIAKAFRGGDVQFTTRDT